ncbi:hypothetical protein CL619_00980 [archaeon]|nr:hypothetical protein [archaeon]|tara:strand:- start:836 stop:1387 length:552 start_codon:yes stop_codon:yes gene_type:complete
MAETIFRNAITFLNDIGLYDVVLPFLLVFTLVFAILEKTKLLGIGELEGEKVTKKNLNAMTAFICAFLVIASTQLVGVINEIVANVVLLLILSVCFMLLVGSFHGEGEFTLKDFPGWIKMMMTIMFIGIAAIFLNAMGWLETLIGLLYMMDVEWVSSLVFLLLVAGMVGLIIREPKTKKKDKD